METLRQYFRNDQFATSNGVELLEVRPGYAVAQMRLGPDQLNSLGTAHGGALFTLADLAFAAACNSSGKVTVAIAMNIACMKAATSGIIRAEAVEVSRSRKISTCQVRLTDESGAEIALFQGTGYVKDAPFPPNPTK